MDVLDDARLAELAQDPVREILPVNRRTTALGSVVILLAFVPGIFFFPEPVLDEDSARIALQSLTQSSPASPKQFETVGSLANWLTARSLQCEFLLPARRLLGLTFCGSALLMLVLFTAVRRWGTLRFAIIAITIASCHPSILAMGSRLPANSWALACAIWVFVEVTELRRRDSSWVSWPLVRAGFAIGVCALLSSSVAMAAVLIVFLQGILSGSMRQATVGTFSHRRLKHLGTSAVVASAMAAFLLVMTTVFIAGGEMIVNGWELNQAMTVILRAFQMSLSIISSVLPESSDGQTFAMGDRALLDLAGVMSGLALLGIVSAFDSRAHAIDIEWDRSGRSWLLAWSAVAMGFWWLDWSNHQGQFVSSSAWTGWILLALILWGARGAESLWNRQWGLTTALIVVVVTTVVNAVPYFSWEDFAATFDPPRFINLAIVFVVLGGVVFAILRSRTASQSTQRVGLIGCVVGLVLINAAIGLSSLPKPDDDERELAAFRQAILSDQMASEFWLITDESDAELSPRLVFFLRTLRAEAPVRFATSWDAALVQGTQTQMDGSQSATICVVVWGGVKWTMNEARRHGQSITPLTAVHYFERRPLKAYRWTSRTASRASERRFVAQ